MSMLEVAIGGALTLAGGVATQLLTERREDRRVAREHRRADQSERRALLDETLVAATDVSHKMVQYADLVLPGQAGAFWGDTAGRLFTLAARYRTDDPIGHALLDCADATQQYLQRTSDKNREAFTDALREAIRLTALARNQVLASVPDTGAERPR